MPVRAVCKPRSPDLKRGALATDARGCSLWRTLLERPPPAPESRVRDPLGELVRTRVGGVTYALEQVPNPAPGGPLSSRVQLHPQLNTPEPANQDLIRHTSNF